MDLFNFIFLFPILFCRHFNLRMKRDTSLFSDEFKVETSNKILDYDTSHIYTGHIYGKLNLKRTLFFNFFLHEEICLFWSIGRCFRKEEINPQEIWIYHEGSLKNEVILGPIFTCTLNTELCIVWLLKGWIFDSIPPNVRFKKKF